MSNDDVTFFFVLYGGITAFVWMLWLLDWLGRRQERKAEKHKAA